MCWANPRLDYTNFNFLLNISNKECYDSTALEAGKNTVKYIVNNYPEPYYICASGGVDSQAMIYAWLISGTPFYICTAIYNNYLNKHDIENLEKFLKIHNLEVNYLELDVLHFLENEHDFYARQYYSGSPHITTYMKIADILEGGTVIFGGNFMDNETIRFVDYNVFSLYHYAVLSKRPCVPFFLCETEELAYSFKLTPKILEDKINKINNYQAKVNRYHEHGYPVIPQEKQINGFEKIKEYYDDHLPRPITLREKVWRTIHQRSRRNFDLLFRNKYEAMFTSHKYDYLC